MQEKLLFLPLNLVFYFRDNAKGKNSEVVRRGGFLIALELRTQKLLHEQKEQYELTKKHGSQNRPSSESEMMRVRSMDSTYTLGGVLLKNPKSGQTSAFAKKNGRWFTFSDGHMRQVSVK